jgi:hypothetical protein
MHIQLNVLWYSMDLTRWIAIAVAGVVATAAGAQTTGHLTVTAEVVVCPILAFDGVGPVREVYSTTPRVARFEVPLRIAATIPWALTGEATGDDSVSIWVAGANKPIPSSAPLVTGTAARRELLVLMTIPRRDLFRVVPVTLHLGCTNASDAVSESTLIVRVPVRGYVATVF